MKFLMDASSEHSDIPLLRPHPRRPYTDTTNTDTPFQPSTPHLGGELGEASDAQDDFLRTRSIVNLTSSTLFGIYSPAAFTDASLSPTPWGTGAETPTRSENTDALSSYNEGLLGSEIEARLQEKSNGRTDHQAHYPPDSSVVSFLRTVLRIAILFGFGLAYGGLVTHLHDNRNVAPVRVEGLNRASWHYFLFWGISGVGIGSLLPWIDGGEQKPASGITNGQWNEAVRSIGAFAGVAFAIVGILDHSRGNPG
ncbi:hypothetical protein FKW77_003670 [Venturia effusa]|uniref:Uncharacterized protein n=1 Tax=Venturia effusa TaxID=50376 RepID=A0A517LAR2_9PEZI|nr:hypothetical protein FKW77_003670 [Venturia effusa]